MLPRKNACMLGENVLPFPGLSYSIHRRRRRDEVVRVFCGRACVCVFTINYLYFSSSEVDHRKLFFLYSTIHISIYPRRDNVFL